MANSKVSSEDLISEVKSGLRQVEEMLKEAASTTGDKATELRANAMAGLKRARDTLADVQDTVMERGKAAARATDDYVHDNPWRALGVAIAVGVVIGLIVTRR